MASKCCRNPVQYEIEGRSKGDMIYLSVRNLRPIDKYQSNPGNQIALENIGERLVLAFRPPGKHIPGCRSDTLSNQHGVSI